MMIINVVQGLAGLLMQLAYYGLAAFVAAYAARKGWDRAK